MEEEKKFTPQPEETTTTPPAAPGEPVGGWPEEVQKEAAQPVVDKTKAPVTRSAQKAAADKPPKPKPFKTVFWITQVLTVLFLVLFVFAMIERGFFTTYLATYGVLIVGLVAAVVALLRKDWKVALLDAVVGGGCFGIYLLLTQFVFR